MAITHAKTSAKADVGDATLIEPSDWNGDHTIASGTVTLAQMANVATDSLIGRDTASSGVPESITLNATLSMDGSLHLQRAALTGDVTASAGSNATTLAAGSASNLNSGTLPAGRMPALTGDVTTSSGAVATTIAANAVALSKMATQADQTFLGNISGGTAVPSALTVAQVLTALRTAVGVATTYVVAADVTHTQSNTTLSDVTGLTFNIGASATEIWQVELVLEISATSVSPDIKYGWATVPAAATMLWGATSQYTSVAGTAGLYGIVPVATTPGGTLLASTDTIPSATASGTFGHTLVGKVYGGGTGGAIQFQFAQNTSSATDLKVLKGSSMRVTKLVA